MKGTWAHVEDGNVGATGQGTAVTGSREELLVATQKGREGKTSIGGRNMVALRPGNLGGRSGCKERDQSGVEG